MTLFSIIMEKSVNANDNFAQDIEDSFSNYEDEAAIKYSIEAEGNE